ncbi:uncharacterized protein LOC122935411 [Bufo gargarizans]|uniref:uncharacterized protein LOC122935411 n=1 Tax=Bufo gargarizans TaxID=30331 RepID=UPI001CF4FABF|nr:uncharacterized protein LOC122935411 [Bufo gargarizans]
MTMQMPHRKHQQSVVKAHQQKPQRSLPHGVQVDEIKNRWWSCRDQFRKEMALHGRSGSGPLKKRLYIYIEQLMFLRDIMDVRPTEDNLEKETEQAAQQHSSAAEEENPPSLDTEEMAEARPSTSSTPHIPPAESAPSLQLGARRKLSMPKAEVEVNTRVLDYLSRVRQEDHYELYGRSLGTLFKKVPEDLYLQTQGAIGIIIQAATPPKDPTELFIALENWRLYGNIYGPPPRPPSQFPNRAPHYPPPPRQPFPPPPQQYGHLYSAEATYPPPAPSAAQAAPPQHFAPSSHTLTLLQLIKIITMHWKVYQVLDEESSLIFMKKEDEMSANVIPSFAVEACSSENADNFSNLEESIQEQDYLIQHIKNLPTIENIQGLFKDWFTPLKSDLSEIKTDLKHLNDRIDSIEVAQQTEIFNLQMHIDDLENRSRRNNLRIKGMPESVDDKDVPKALTSIFLELLGKEDDFDIGLERAHSVYRLKSVSADSPRDIL